MGDRPCGFRILNNVDNESDTNPGALGACLQNNVWKQTTISLRELEGAVAHDHEGREDYFAIKEQLTSEIDKSVVLARFASEKPCRNFRQGFKVRPDFQISGCAEARRVLLRSPKG